MSINNKVGWVDFWQKQCIYIIPLIVIIVSVHIKNINLLPVS